MGWRPVLESIEHEAEPLLGLIVIDAQSLEYLQLQIIIVNTDTATADLIAIQNQVVTTAANSLRMVSEKTHIFFHWGGKGMMDSEVTIFGNVIFQQRETRYPGEVKLVIICEFETVAEVAPQNVQSRVNYIRLTRHEKNKIACLKVGGFSKQIFLSISEVFGYRTLPVVFLHFDPSNTLGSSLYVVVVS